MEQQPFLRPPTQEYIDKHCRSQPSATVSARERPAARLFEAMANEPEPTDLSKFFKEMPSAKELKEDLISSKRSRILLLLLSGVQALCGFAVTASLIQAQAETTRTAEDSMLLATLLLIGASGIIGLVGACRWWAEALQLFFITQIWSLSTLFSQFLKHLQARRRQDIFCEESAGADAGGCGDGESQSLVVFTLVGALIVVYVSMFLSDNLSEFLQDKLENEDQQQIIQFVWTMNKKSLLGIHRFEELIHAEFEKLVNLGFLKLKRGE